MPFHVQCPGKIWTAAPGGPRDCSFEDIQADRRKAPAPIWQTADLNVEKEDQ